jgi:hypothetical protein
MSEYREITGLYKKFYSDEPLANATINFKLSVNSFTLSAVYPSTQVNANAQNDPGINVQTDANGNLPAGFKLFTNSQTIGSPTKYLVTEPDGFKWEFILPPGNNPVSVQELRAGGQPVASPDTILSLIQNTELGDLFDVLFTDLQDGDVVTWDEASGKWVNGSAAGGGEMAIGSGVTGGTAGSVFFADADGALAQNNSNFHWDSALKKLTLMGYNELMELKGAPGAYWIDLLKLTSQGYGTSTIFRQGEIFNLIVGGNALQLLNGNTAVNAVGFNLNYSGDSKSTPRIWANSHGAADVLLELKASAGQTADLLQIKNSSDVVISGFDKKGALRIATISNADAPNSSLYYSSDNSKLVYKDAAGTVNNLY